MRQSCALTSSSSARSRTSSGHSTRTPSRREISASSSSNWKRMLTRRASAQPKQTFGHRECDVKKAVPQSKRYAAGGMGRGNGMRPYGAAGGGRGAGANNGGWYGAWGQMGAMPYGGAAWGDWYSAAAAGNYYPTAQNGYNAYGAGKKTFGYANSG
ncbi:hypothetical protein WR25_16202 [Diploscapter pachys]|uniref:Uncharacterized protein n=1 Tax=Diploscapter pachys TaxID=2018661 RepID=A0A2A2M3C2_9BILA|nr:hypothetical protein WR25_16202 [Diploscapter pachys]